MIGGIAIAAAMVGAALGALPAMAVAPPGGLRTDALVLEFRPSAMIGLGAIDPATAADVARPLQPTPVATDPSPLPPIPLRKKVV